MLAKESCVSPILLEKCTIMEVWPGAMKRGGGEGFTVKLQMLGKSSEKAVEIIPCNDYITSVGTCPLKSSDFFAQEICLVCIRTELRLTLRDETLNHIHELREPP